MKPALKKKNNKSGEITKDKFSLLVDEFNTLKKNKKLLDTREKELKKQIDSYVSINGAKDNKGSFKMVLGDMLVQKQARSKVSLNLEKAEERLREIGIWEDVIETKEIINEDYVEQAYNEGKLSDTDLDYITDVKVSHAILVGEYKPAEEGEE